MALPYTVCLVILAVSFELFAYVTSSTLSMRTTKELQLLGSKDCPQAPLQGLSRGSHFILLTPLILQRLYKYLAVHRPATDLVLCTSSHLLIITVREHIIDLL